jgi:hypothetical protein
MNMRLWLWWKLWTSLKPILQVGDHRYLCGSSGARVITYKNTDKIDQYKTKKVCFSSFSNIYKQQNSTCFFLKKYLYLGFHYYCAKFCNKLVKRFVTLAPGGRH